MAFRRECGEEKEAYTKWLTLGIGPCREDGSNVDRHRKSKVMDAEKKGEEKEVYTNWLKLGIGSCREDGTSGYIHRKGKVMDAEKKRLYTKREMMASNRESDDSSFIHGIKRMIIDWKGIICEEKEAYTSWVTLGIGPCREDGSNEDRKGNGKVMDADDAEPKGLYTSWLTLRAESCVEDGSRKDAERNGESSHCTVRVRRSWGEDGSNKAVYLMEESMFIDLIPEDILNIIFCKLPFHTLFQIESVCTSWKTIISSSLHFRNLWDQSNQQVWLVMDQYDETSESANGLGLIDVPRRQSFNKLLNGEWRSAHSQWILRGGDGGLLVFSCKKNGTLRVINPLTMQSHSLDDAVINRKSKISSYMKKYHDDVAVHLKFNSNEKTYQVILVIGSLYLLRKKNFFVLIYTSAQCRWEKRNACLDQRLNRSLTVGFLPTILVHNNKIYCFSENGADVGMYDLNGDCKSRFLYTLGMQRPMWWEQTLGIVMYKGRMIMVRRTESFGFSASTALMFYEFDDVGMQWRSKYKAVVQPHYVPRRLICVGGDYIWVMQKRAGHASHIISVDIDAGELKIWPEVLRFMFNVRKCLSMPLKFYPCP